MKDSNNNDNIDMLLDKIKEIKQQLAEKDCRIEELEGQFAYECECNKQLVELQKQLAEKDKEIEWLKEQDGEYHNALAIQELEKVKVGLRAKLHLLESGHLRHL